MCGVLFYCCLGRGTEGEGGLSEMFRNLKQSLLQATAIDLETKFQNHR